MKKNIKIHYDKKGDLLEIRIGKPTESYYEDLGEDIFERHDKKTKEIKGYAIFNFKKRTRNINVDLPLQIELTS